MITINGVELEFNIYDYETASRYEGALRQLQAVTVQPGAGLAETIKSQCALVFDFFDTVFGDGTAEKVFKGKQDFRICTQALGDVINAAKAQQAEYSNLLSQYVPNRAARRAK